MFQILKLEPRPLRWWMSQYSQIDLTPVYQRGGRIWSRTDKAFLIDSILNGYDIPKIYMTDFTVGIVSLNRRGLPYAIIDGKQRLEAMFDFFSGEPALLLDDEFVFQPNPKLKLNGLGYKDLTKNYPEIADIFNNYPLSVVHVVTDEKDKINELFVRLNRSKPLTGAEIRNAMAGPLPDIIRLLAGHELFKLRVKFSTTRAQDKNAASKLLLFEYEKRPVETKRSALDRFVKRAKKDNMEKLELASRRVIDTLDRMSEIFLPGDPLLRSAGVFPVYYWFIRESSTVNDRFVREFLNFFEKARKENREKAAKSATANEADNELLTFDRFNRSTDDERSHVERHRVLTARFQKYLQELKS
ncbi:MAG: DUF262 domain-containing protein [Thermodesulfobacteriota bacterium]